MNPYKDPDFKGTTQATKQPSAKEGDRGVAVAIEKVQAAVKTSVAEMAENPGSGSESRPQGRQSQQKK